jgi:hypothetical protein
MEKMLPDVLAKFDGNFNPRRNVLFEWYVFQSLVQAENEPIDLFVKILRTHAAMCEFGEQKDMDLLTRCVFGQKNVKLKEKLLSNPDITLPAAIELTRASEMTRTQMESMGASQSIAAVEKETPPTPAPGKLNCKFCGYEHVKGKCPAYSKTCRKCGGRNHFASACNNTRKEVNTIADSSKELSMNDLFIGMVNGQTKESSWFKKIQC